ncbi:helix-turn-helix domain-containing protein [Murimonas intestini]|uniref:helix-turn-helix domain-containing protein n=1 Tax=Murimonas intestini TaxID=1337051 RepID=UPI00248C332C|nr:helix-turn-helix transcriptional regulator [Murimonas intestini]
MDDRYILLGLNIAYFRKLRMLTQKSLAEKIGISRAHLSHIESCDGRSVASLDTIFKIADALNVLPDRLFDFSAIAYKNNL